jgi:UDP-N-acetylmuramyl pentapeptide phosphotransferase/UDP-N-acetylglucosamine-1-phosphate transferase
MIVYILLSFIISTVCGLIFTPLILDFCKKKKLYDIPNERKVHKNAIPRLGGISFFPSMMTAFAIQLLYFSMMQRQDIPINIWSAGFIFGLGIIYIVGIVDDLIGLNANVKFFVQITTACILPLTGLYINNLYGLFGIHDIPAFVGMLLTVFVIVFIVNAVNLIDGSDGLASGLSLLALCGFLAYFIHYQVYLNTYAVLAAGMLGVLVAFMFFNIFGKTENNTKIFMGDSGSLSLGFTLGFLAVKCAMNNVVIWPYRPEALIVPVTLLFVPAIDVVRVTFYRLRHHKPLFDADKNHIHHKLMRAGLTQHQALCFILLLAIAYAGMNYVMYQFVSTTWILVTDIVVYTLLNLGINTRLKE